MTSLVNPRKLTDLVSKINLTDLVSLTIHISTTLLKKLKCELTVTSIGHETHITIMVIVYLILGFFGKLVNIVVSIIAME
jgi:hypothetical protein